VRKKHWGIKIKMSTDKDAIQDAINRAINAANRAVKRNAYEKVADIYYRIASMLNDLGDEAGAQNFSNAAKQFKERNQIIGQINLAIQTADEAYGKVDYATVAENYFKISSLSELIGDKNTADRFKAEAEKFLKSAKSQPQASKTGMKTMKEFAPTIQSQVPSSVQLNPPSKQVATSRPVKIDDAMMVLGLVCPNCGAEVNPELDICPKCNKTV